MTVTEIRGNFAFGDVKPNETVALFDFLIRSHCLGETLPIPMTPVYQDLPIRSQAQMCLMFFGRFAKYSSTAKISREIPSTPLYSQSILHMAASDGDLAALKSALECGTPIDCRCEDGATPLVWAVVNSSLESVRMLAASGCEIDARNKGGESALMAAAEQDDCGIVDHLLENGADPNLIDARGFTALHRAAEIGMVAIVQKLLAAGAAPDLIGDGGFTPKALALKNQHQGIVAILDEALNSSSR